MSNKNLHKKDFKALKKTWQTNDVLPIKLDFPYIIEFYILVKIQNFKNM